MNAKTCMNAMSVYDKTCERGAGMNRKIMAAVAAAAVAAWFIIFNTVLSGYSGTYHLHDGHEWTQLSWEVLNGDADQFTAELAGPQKLKVSYKGEYELAVLLTLKDNAGNSSCYELKLFEETVPPDNTLEVQTEFTLLEK